MPARSSLHELGISLFGPAFLGRIVSEKKGDDGRHGEREI